jgi:hypothetical protein
MAERQAKSPRGFVRHMPEGERAGQGATEAVEPAPGRADAKGAAGFLTHVAQLGLGALVRLRGARGAGGGPGS